MPQVTTLIFGLLYRFTICNKANIRYNHRHGSQSNEELRRSSIQVVERMMNLLDA